METTEKSKPDDAKVIQLGPASSTPTVSSSGGEEGKTMQTERRGKRQKVIFQRDDDDYR